MTATPMFPLGSVLLPQMVLPLHVFEPRYRAMVEHCLAGDRRFGVVMIERGSEVGGGEVRSALGCLAEIVRADPAPDGRWGLVAVGTERIRVDAWLEDAPYPRAEVSPWPDDEVPDLTALAEPYAGVVERLRRVLGLAVELGAPADGLRALDELDEDPRTGVWQVAILAPVGSLDRQRVLAVPGPGLRLAVLEDLLAEQEELLRGRLGS